MTKDVATIEKKYNMKKQSIYGRRNTINKNIQKAGTTLNALLNGAEVKPSTTPKKGVSAKKARGGNGEVGGIPLTVQFGGLTVRIRGKIQNLAVDGNILDIHV
jgi:hypothetical protein